MRDTLTTQTLRMERLLDAPIDKVWQYLVDPELRARWFMSGPTDLRVGGLMGMTMDHDRLSDQPVPTPAQYQAWIGHRWNERITRCEPPHLLAITWEDGAAGEVTFALTAEGERTRLLLTHTGLRGRDDAINFGGGWLSHLAVLERRLRGDTVADFWALHAAAEAQIKQALG